MKVSTRGDYASRALLSLALHADESGPTSVRDIAERTGLPQPYLEQILLALKGAGIVRSKRGVGGGYVLAREPEPDHPRRDRLRRRRADQRRATSASRTRTAPATTRASACCSPSGAASAGSMRAHLDSFTLADIAVDGEGPARLAQRRRARDQR